MVRRWQSCASNRIAVRYRAYPFTLCSAIQPNFRHWRSVRQGEGVSDPPSRRALPQRTHSYHHRQSPVHSSLLISAEPICTIPFSPAILLPRIHHSCVITTRSRVCEVQLNGDQTFGLRQQKYKVSDQLKTGEATALFGKPLAPISMIRLACIDRLSKFSDYLADSVDAFLTSSESPDAPDLPEGEDLPLGLTFSFPVEQAALDSGHLLTWTKGMFHIPTLRSPVDIHA